MGTNTERTGTDAVSGSWVELGRTTLGSTGSSIDVSSLDDKRYYMLLCNGDPVSSPCSDYIQMNGDTGSNYSWRISADGGADSTSTSTTSIGGSLIDSSETVPRFYVAYVANHSTNSKSMMLHATSGKSSGAGTAPSRREWVGKWANISNAINRFNYAASSNFATGSEMVVLGWDESDTHTNNFWELLDSSNGDGTGGWTSGTFTAKKYLWIQAWIEPSTTLTLKMRPNGSSSSDKAWRNSDDGTADNTNTSANSWNNMASISTPHFINMFIVNDGTNEPLMIGHAVGQNTAGAGNAPQRWEFVGKTSATTQFTSFEMNVTTGNLSTSSIMNIWGAD